MLRGWGEEEGAIAGVRQAEADDRNEEEEEEVMAAMWCLLRRREERLRGKEMQEEEQCYVGEGGSGEILSSKRSDGGVS
eukprot:572174-Hanusia_phi.AAC.2